MLVLDTDHIVELDHSPTGPTLESKLAGSREVVATTVVTPEEQFRGWLAQIRREHDLYRQTVAYERFQQRIDFFAAWKILPWTNAAADILVDLRRQRIRIGTMDLKIASIVMSRNATLLSRNLRDFQQVPGLVVEDWT